MPSILRSLEILTDLEPDEVYLSTPGPVGLTGLLLAKLTGCRSVAVYHTDYARQAERIAGDGSWIGLLEDGVRWFCTAADEVAVPTLEYIEILDRRGFDPSRLRLFRRGLDSEHFRPREDGRTFLRETFGVEPGVTLLYVGRISKEKNLDRLAGIFPALAAESPDLRLVVTGDGPYVPELRRSLAGTPGVVFTGRQGPEQLPLIYSGAELLVFPSETDTFGMAVLEAQSCGLPALVSDVGGPKELIRHGRTGWVVRDRTPEGWAEGIRRAATMVRRHPALHEAMRREARRWVVEERNWAPVLQSYVDGVGLWDGEDAGEREAPQVAGRIA